MNQTTTTDGEALYTTTEDLALELAEVQDRAEMFAAWMTVVQAVNAR